MQIWYIFARNMSKMYQICIFLTKNFIDQKFFLHFFDQKIRRAQAAFQNEFVSQDLAFIQANFSVIVISIRCVEAYGVRTLDERMCDDISRSLYGTKRYTGSNIGVVLREKMRYV
jgi:hypothetical protein